MVEGGGGGRAGDAEAELEMLSWAGAHVEVEAWPETALRALR